jgi:transposase
MQSILGIDISKDTFDVALIWEGGQTHREFGNHLEGFRKLMKWLKANAIEQVHACMEATGQYGDGLAEYLYEQGQLVSVENPSRIKRYRESKLHRNINDKSMAIIIAEFCQKEETRLWKPLSPEKKRLRALNRRLADQKTIRQQEINRLKSGEKDSWVIKDLESHINYLDERIDAIQKEIKALINQIPELKKDHDLLTSITGIGEITANLLLAEIDISDFENAPQLAAYVGLNPQSHISGTSVHRKTRISKQGRSSLRSSLYMPAIVAMSYNPIIQVLDKRLSERGKTRMEVVVASMKKLLHIAYGVLKNQTPFDPHYGDQFDFSS